jgi:hypothetical protein
MYFAVWSPVLYTVFERFGGVRLAPRRLFCSPGACPLRRTVVDDISFPPLIIPPLFSLISWHRAIDCLVGTVPKLQCPQVES